MFQTPVWNKHTKNFMAYTETVNRILDAAEILFAEKGFSETSLRMITGKAKVNLAAVNYHFGSKNALIQAVFNRFLSPLNELMVDGLKANRWGQSDGKVPTIEEVLRLYTNSLLRIPTRNENGVSIFMRLLGLAYTQSQGHLRKYLEDEYSQTFWPFLSLIKQITPELSTTERFWRTQFVIGSMAFTMSSIQQLTDILENKAGSDVKPEQVVDYLVPFLAAGLSNQSSAVNLGVTDQTPAS
jgi:AcrR family transcriptional regulator